MATHSARIDIWHLAKQILMWLIVPLAAGIAIDLTTGLWPIVTIFAAVLVVPLAGVVVSRAALHEMDRVVQEVAPDLESPDLESTVPEGEGKEETVADANLEGA